MSAIQNPMTIAGASRREVVQGVSTAIRDRLYTLDLPHSDQLVQDAHEIFSAWLSGDVTEYFAYLDSAGQAPPDAPVWHDPDAARRAFASSTATLQKAAFDPTATSVRPQFLQGEPILPVERHARSWGSRYDKLGTIQTAAATLEEIKSKRVDVHEVLVPIRLDGEVSKEPFDGMLGLSYGWDSQRRRWTLVAVSVYGIPNGDAAIIPPF